MVICKVHILIEEGEMKCRRLKYLLILKIGLAAQGGLDSSLVSREDFLEILHNNQ